jgi:hypothetical protein
MNLEKIIEFGEIKGQILAIKEIPIKIWPSIGKNYKIGVKDEETFRLHQII